MAASTSSYREYILWSAGIRLRRWSRILVTVAAGMWMVFECHVFLVLSILAVMFFIVDNGLRTVFFFVPIFSQDFVPVAEESVV